MGKEKNGTVFKVGIPTAAIVAAIVGLFVLFRGESTTTQAKSVDQVGVLRTRVSKNETSIAVNSAIIELQQKQLGRIEDGINELVKRKQ